MIFEMRVYIAPGPRKSSHRHAPCRWIWSAGLDICRDERSRKEVDLDCGGCPLHGINPATRSVESRAIAQRVCGCEAASCVAGAGCGGENRGGEGSAALKNTTFGCVERDGIRCLQVHAFDDVDLARIWPVGAKSPECRPDAAGATWHMGDISNEETLCVCPVGSDTHRVAATSWIHDLVINTQIDCSIGEAREAALVCSNGALVVDKPASRVCAREEAELGEEVGVVERIDDGIRGLCGASSANHRCAEGQEKMRDTHDGGWLEEGLINMRLICDRRQRGY
jgi:hypothetical protein